MVIDGLAAYSPRNSSQPSRLHPLSERIAPLSALTWNVSQRINPKSAQAPADEVEWCAQDNLVAVQH